MRKTLYLIGFSLLSVPILMADSACTTSSNYLSAGFTCSIGDVDFSNFYYNSPTGIPASDLTVTPETTADGPGFLFGVSGMTISTGSEDVQVGFTATAISGEINDLGIGFDGYSTGTGATNFTESYCFTSESPTVCEAAPTNDFAVSKPPGPLSQEITFTPVTSITVFKDVGDSAGSDGTASISTFANTFSTVPEPTYTALLAAGLLGLGWLKRRQSKA